MKILLTNDDGAESEGISALSRALAGAGHEVWTVAPDRNRSGASHCLTMEAPLQIKKLGERTFSCSGSPVDCVLFAVKSGIALSPFDAVFSGINRGANLGTDILYSGTAAAAAQAVVYGIPAAAFSVETRDGAWRYSAMASFAARNARALAALSIPARPDDRSGAASFVNVNALSLDRYSAIESPSSLAWREYNDEARVSETGDGNLESRFCGGSVVSFGGDETDSAVCDRSSICVCRVRAEPCLSPREIDLASLSL